jgi:selenide, water dikinase
VIVGHAGSDDAGVYRLSDETAMVLTVDFFTPIVDDPYDYGRVAATNSLSDVYAMGGRPVVALNVAGFPENKIPADVLGEIIRGGADVARAAGVSIVGGHTVNDAELKYGLAVIGLIDPRRVVRNAGARAGDVLVLTKAIGTGVLATALKKRALSAERTKVLVDSMTQLNAEASLLMLQHDPHACTDITGYGLIGHANEMAQASDVTIVLRAASVPLLDGAKDAAEQGHLTGGGNATRRFLQDNVRMAASVGEAIVSLLFDPQTSGGLLIAVARERATELLGELKSHHPHAAVVGECVARRDNAILVE